VDTFEQKKRAFEKRCKGLVESLDKILTIETSEGTKSIENVPEVVANEFDIYKFTLPITQAKRVAIGFPTREEAIAFRDKHLKTKVIEVGGKTTIVAFEVVPSYEQVIDVFKNQKETKTREQLLEEWNTPTTELEIIPSGSFENNQWVG